MTPCGESLPGAAEPGGSTITPDPSEPAHDAGERADELSEAAEGLGEPAEDDCPPPEVQPAAAARMASAQAARTARPLRPG